MTQVTLEAVRSLKMISEIAKQFNVHPSPVTLWKKQFPEDEDQAFESTGSKAEKECEPEAAELYQQIRRLRVVNMTDFLRKQV